MRSKHLNSLFRKVSAFKISRFSNEK